MYIVVKQLIAAILISDLGKTGLNSSERFGIKCCIVARKMLNLGDS